MNSPVRRGLVADFREFFTLQHAETAAAAFAPTERAELRQTVRVARQKTDAAEKLWLSGCPAEGFQLALDSASRLLSVDAALARRLGDRAGSENFASSVSRVRSEWTQDLLVATSVFPPPQLDVDVRMAHTRTFNLLVALERKIAGELSLATMEAGQRKRVRLARWFGSIASIAGVAVLVLVFVFRPPSLSAEASAVYSPAYLASKAVDGKKDTEWVLPDRTPGWLDISVSPPRKLSKLRILNIHNPPNNDRATKDYRVVVFSQGASTRIVDGSFSVFTESPQWVTHAIDAVAVDRIRIELKSYHKEGAGIAEVEVE